MEAYVPSGECVGGTCSDLVTLERVMCHHHADIPG